MIIFVIRLAGGKDVHTSAGRRDPDQPGGRRAFGFGVAGFEEITTDHRYLGGRR
jgi:hypothetical protein